MLFERDLPDHAAPWLFPTVVFLYRILVEAYQWVSQQARLRDGLASIVAPMQKGRPRCRSKVGGASPQRQSQDKSQVQVIARAAAILRALEEQPAGLSLGQIAQRVELARSTVQRIVAALAAEKLLIAASPTGRVRLGPTILRLAASARTDFVAIARPFLVRLSNELSETVDLATIQKDHLIFIDQVIGPQRLRAVSAVGETFPLYCTANGKAYLAQLDEVAIARLIGTELRAAHRRTPSRGSTSCSRSSRRRASPAWRSTARSTRSESARPAWSCATCSATTSRSRCRCRRSASMRRRS